MKLLLTGAFSYTDEQIEYLKSLGHEIIFVQDERKSIELDVSDIEGVICNGLFLYTPIEKFTSLKYIQLTSAGFDRVPMDYITEHGIEIHNAKGVYSIPMAEFAVCGVLELYKQSKFFIANQNAHMWEKHRGLLELSGKRVCIVGAGNIGSEVAKRFKAFDTTVIGIDLYPNDNEYFDKVLPLSQLDSELALADIVILTLPLTKDNAGFFNKEKFDLMKNTSIFVNIARGKLVNEQDLINALESNRISGAVLDVFEEEPLNQPSNLWDMDNVILTPHNSFIGEKNQARLINTITNNLL
ncbi:MAG: hydroxyacid dehydrogenase [Eubacterium sp.]|nr:hydroxyacid dehydrogenase [Eubacterium sp.]